jgi:hypothetical protein
MPIPKKLFFIASLIIISIGINAQIISPSANDSVVASYGNHKVFIFNAPQYKAPVIASIIAVAPDQNTDWVFQWSVYSPVDSGFIAISGSQTGNRSIIDTITVQAGYTVQMNRGIETIYDTVWVIINDLDVKITNKDASDTLLYGYYDCSSLDLHADTTRTPAWYYNPHTNQRLYPGNMYTIRWTTDNPETGNPSSRLLTRVTDPPWKDTWYILTITDRFGMKRKDSVVYNSIQSKAVISLADYISPAEDSLIHPRHDWYEKFYNYNDGSKSAPALYKFDLSASKNLVSYEFDFGDGDSLLLGNDSLLIYHDFKKPGLYKALLTTRSGPPFECIDSVSVTVQVDEATGTNFIMPNVFTPDGSQNKKYIYSESAVNDVFRTTDVSVIYLDISIYSRTGLKVHAFEGNIRDWGGWDGKIMNSNRDAPEGVYFYVISQLDAYQDHNDPIRKKEMKGFIHLYRK